MLTLPFYTEHKLEFEARPWRFGNLFQNPLEPSWMEFRVGTCEGTWRSTDEGYEILAIKNSKKGNGHFNDVLQWFEHSCRRDKKALTFLAIMNKKFAKHMVEKRGFEKIIITRDEEKLICLTKKYDK